jgi:hypothetical protein
VKHRADQEERLRRHPVERPCEGFGGCGLGGTGAAYEADAGIWNGYRITGEDCYIFKVWLRSIGDLEPILDLFTPHGRTTTSIVHSAPVPPRPPPVPVDSPVTGGSKISAMSSPRRG